MNRTVTNSTDAKMDILLDLAREQGRLSGEVRVLKWAVGAAFVALIAALGAIYTEMNQGFREVNQQFRDVSQQFQDVSGRIDQLARDVSEVRERLVRVEGYIGDLGAARAPQAREAPR